MTTHSLNEAANEILSGNVASKRLGQDGTKKIEPSIAYGTKSAGVVGRSPTKKDDELPDYLSGTPSATPPGAKPPVGPQLDGVGATKPKNQPQETEGRSDLIQVAQCDATHMDQIRDRIAGKLPNQMMQKNPGATFQSYSENIDLSDDVRALLEGETLSDEFKTKAITIFEAAVKSRIDTISEEIEAKFTDEFEVAVEHIKEDIAEKVDSYLNYMIEEWMKENEVAIEHGLRTEITEEFMTKLRALFVESYIDIPAEKVDVVEGLATKVEELENSLNEEIKTSMGYHDELNEYKKIIHIQSVCEGLSKIQIAKVKLLAESIDFTTDQEFETKVMTIKESYFPSQVIPADGASLNEEIIIEDEKKSKKTNDPNMNAYLSALDKSVAK